MKRTLAAILAIAPVMLHAQAKSSAQPVSTPVLQSNLVQPVALHPADRAATTASSLRISTGITAPRLVYTKELGSSYLKIGRNIAGDRTIVIDMIVDSTGKPTNLKVVKSLDAYTDQGVLTAVSQYRFQPAALDGTTIAIPLTLRYVIQ